MDTLSDKLRERGMIDLSQEQLDKIFADKELSKSFYLLLFFALATGKSFEELIDLAKPEEE